MTVMTATEVERPSTSAGARTDRRAEHSAGSGRPTASGSGPLTVLVLQRSAGNAAVARLVGSPGLVPNRPVSTADYQTDRAAVRADAVRLLC